MDKRVYVEHTPEGFQIADVDFGKSAPYVDTRFPSRYKKLTSYTLNWRTRLTFEAAASPCMFLTMTYDDAHYVDDIAKLKKDFQQFRQNLKQYLGYTHPEYAKFRYYAITERGENGTERLHFHALIYGFPYQTYRTKHEGKFVDMVQFNEWTDLITKYWPHGFVFFEAANGTAINYVTKYIHKRLVSGDYISLKSQGLGLSFLDPAKLAFFKDNEQTTYKIGTRTYFLPRYLKQKIWTDKEELSLINEKIARESALCERQMLERFYVDFGENRYYMRHEFDPMGEYVAPSWDKQQDKFRKEALQFLQDQGINPFEFDGKIFYNEQNDTIRIIFVDHAKDKVQFHRARERVYDSYRYKSVFNKRL